MLEALGLADTGERARLSPVPAPAKFASFELDGWRFVISADHRFASRERVVAVSQGGAAIGAYLEEHVMLSGAFGASGGALVWSVQHDCDHGLEHLDVWGEPPAALAGIRRALLDQLRNDEDTDYVFEAPINLAAEICGFNPNTFERELDIVSVAVARKDLMKLRDQPLASDAGEASAQGGPAPVKAPGWLARLFGRG